MRPSSSSLPGLPLYIVGVSFDRVAHIGLAKFLVAKRQDVARPSERLECTTVFDAPDVPAVAVADREVPASIRPGELLVLVKLLLVRRKEPQLPIALMVVEVGLADRSHRPECPDGRIGWRSWERAATDDALAAAALGDFQIVPGVP